MKRLILPVACLPSVALAHPGDHSGAAFWHLITEPDHLAALIALLAIVALVVYHRARS